VELSKGSFHQFEILIMFSTEFPAYHCFHIVTPEADITTAPSGAG
jgi:hypothetical protein